MSVKKRLALYLAIALAITLWIMHTAWVERPLATWLEQQAAAQDIHLEIGKLDLYPFGLKAKVRNVKVQGLGIDAQLKQAFVNAGAGILFGHIDLDQIALVDGHIGYQPPEPSTTVPREPKPLAIPKIQIDEASVERVTLAIEDRQSTLNVAVRDVGLHYDGKQLDAVLASEAFAIGTRTVPPIKVSLKAETLDFQSFEEIHGDIRGDDSRVSLSGRIAAGFQPELSIHGLIGEDLLPEWPQLEFSAELRDDQLLFAANRQQELGGQSYDLSVSTAVVYTRMPMKIPVVFTMDGLAEGELNLTYQSDHLSGSMQLNGDPAGLQTLLPEYPLEKAMVFGEFSMPDLNPKALIAHGHIESLGAGPFRLNWQYDQEQLRFKGTGQPLPDTELSLAGSWQNQWQARLVASASSATALSPYITLPEDFGSGPLNAELDLITQAGTPVVTSGLISATSFSLMGFEETFTLEIEGPLDHLNGQLFGPTLNHSQPFIRFDLDVMAQRWLSLTLQLDSQPICIADQNIQVKLEATGSGPMTNPNLQGHLALQADQDSLPYTVNTGLNLIDGQIQIQDLALALPLGELSGSLDFRPGPSLAEWRWNTDLRFVSTGATSQVLPEGLALPRFELQVVGNERDMDFQMQVPEQILPLAGLAIPIVTDSSIHANGNLSRQAASGQLPGMTIAGLRLDQIQLEIREGELRLGSQFKVNDPTRLQTILGQFWPEELSIQSGEGIWSLQSDLAFSQPKLHLALIGLEGAYADHLFNLTDVQFEIDERLHLEPVTTEFMGLRLTASSLPEHAVPGVNPKRDEEIESPLNLHLGFEVLDDKPIRDFLGDQWPEGLRLDKARGRLSLDSDLDLKDPKVHFHLAAVDLVMDDEPLSVREAYASYDRGIWVKPFELDLAGSPITFQPTAMGFKVATQLTVDQVEPWLPGLLGDGVLAFGLNWQNQPSGDFSVSGSLKLVEGQIIRSDPWLHVNQLDLRLTQETGQRHRLDGTLNLNEGSLEISSHWDRSDTDGELFIRLFGEGIELHLPDLQAEVDGAMEYRLAEKVNDLQATILIDDAHYHPDIELGQLAALLSPVPEIWFPDPVLEPIQLQANIITKTPIIVENKLGYWELETPSLFIGGNLAEPIPRAGAININEGSTLKQKNATYVFQGSQVQFHANRPGDPYLQLAIVETNHSLDEQPIYVTGYVSQLGQNLGNYDISSFLLNYLLNDMTSLVSFDIELNSSILETGFTPVISKPLADKAIVRYAIPLNGQQSKRRLELRLGPYRSNFLDVVDENAQQTFTLKHLQRFGFSQDRPTKVRSVTMHPATLPKWLRRSVSFNKNDIYSETRWRRAVFDMRQALKERGHLNPILNHQFEDGELRIEIDPGPRTELEITGVPFSSAETTAIFGQLRSGEPLNLAYLERVINHRVIAKGYPSAAVFLNQTDNLVSARVLVGLAAKETKLEFGAANPLLLGLYSEDNQRQFLNEYFVSREAKEAELRARLAAQGYVKPVFEETQFLDIGHILIPIEPGPKANLAAVTVNGKPFDHELVGQPFQYEFLELVNKDIVTSRGVPAIVSHKARRQDKDIIMEALAFDIPETKIDNLTIAGNKRIDEKKIKRFLRFGDGLSQDILIRRQQELTRLGVFQSARLISRESGAELLVSERNRWDVNYELSWEEKESFGYAVQFWDRMLFHGFNELSVRAAQNSSEEALISRLTFHHVFGTPVDTSIILEWNNQLKDPLPPSVDFDPENFEEKSISQLTERRQMSLEFDYPLTRFQTLKGGVDWQRNLITQTTSTFDVFDPEQPVLRERSDTLLSFDLVPLRLSWLYQNLDNELYPNQGIFASFGSQIFPRALGTDAAFEGTRLLFKFNTFLTRGRWRWSERLEIGWFDRKVKNNTIGDEELSFKLGGAKSIRGFATGLVGPVAVTFSEDSDGARNPEVIALGGEAMALFSQELDFDFRFYGLGLSPFLDSGWVWPEDNELFKSGLVVTGGLGLTWQTPIGRFRFDWAQPIERGPLDEQFKGLLNNSDDIRSAREAIKQEFSFRFGRVF